MRSGIISLILVWSETFSRSDFHHLISCHISVMTAALNAVQHNDEWEFRVSTRFTHF